MHNLGRVKSPVDSRDWKLTSFLVGDPASDPLDDALEEMLSHRYSPWFRAWATEVTKRVKGHDHTPTPVSPPPQEQVVWSNSELALDQGETLHCVGFGCANWSNADPVKNHFTNEDGHRFYYAAKVFDGEPGVEDGTSVRSGAKALKQDGRLAAYAFAQSLAEVRTWLRAHGPLIVGTHWYSDMFMPTSDGLAAPTGTLEGGHCYLAVGDLPDENAILCLNSWGPDWGLGGYFKMRTDDFDMLLQDEGEAMAAVELPL